ncbi:acyltransferase family protein [Pedobacter fastidiosus]|uniref:Acyltransferase n=1 Tax=Pedobacter fastidiosus TaxID=2765361 RepID=A0ABR7KVU6_9SPHI|nr:acyltransferase [Pedobacter fastidiosus]MBC6112165.1 acyltransferase [Pedobacter fastidiosus]
MNNLISIDLFRGLAAFSVFYYHQQLGGVLAKFTGCDFFNYTNILGSTYAVPLFFLISGFCIHLSSVRNSARKESLNLKKYYTSRFLRIYPIYFFSIIFSLLVLGYTNPQKIISVMDIAVHITVLQGFTIKYFNSINLVLWTITVEIAFYIIYPIFYSINQKLGINKALLFSALVSTLSITICSYSSNNLSLPVIFLFTNLWFGWCFGAWLCEIYHHQPYFFKSRSWAITCCLIVLSFAGLHFLDFRNDNLVKNTLNILIWAPILIWIIDKETFFLKYKKWLKVPIAIGLSSYSLYLLHIPLIALKNSIILQHFNNQYYLIWMLIGTVLIPLICYFSYCTIEKGVDKLRRTYLTK